jgi:hypothetical protein
MREALTRLSVPFTELLIEANVLEESENGRPRTPSVVERCQREHRAQVKLSGIIALVADMYKPFYLRPKNGGEAEWGLRTRSDRKLRHERSRKTLKASQESSLPVSEQRNYNLG